METGKSYSIISLAFPFFYIQSFSEAFNGQKIYLFLSFFFFAYTILINLFLDFSFLVNWKQFLFLILLEWKIPPLFYVTEMVQAQQPDFVLLAGL